MPPPSKRSPQLRSAPATGSTQKILPYAILSLGSFLCGIGLLILMLKYAEVLVRLGLVGRLYYLVLLPLGLSVAAFLFGALRSHAIYVGRPPNAQLELGGPIVGFALVVAGGFYLPQPESETFDFTVFVRGEKGEHDFVLKDSGEVVISLPNQVLRARIREDGQAEFKNISAKFRAEAVPISVQEADRFEPIEPNQKYWLSSNSASVVLKRKSTAVSGRVQDSDGKSVNGASVSAGGIEATTDENGYFSLIFKEGPPVDSIETLINANGFKVWRGNLKPDAGQAMVLLDREP